MTTLKAVVAGASLAAVILFGLAKSQPPSTPAGGAPGPADTTAQDAVVRTAEAFDAAYNARDAKAVAGLFTEQAELADEDGVIRGRDAIRAAFAEVFAEYPEGTIRTEVDEVSLPAPGVAIEQGRTFVVREPGAPEIERRYVVVHARSGDRWEMASVQDAPADEAPSPSDALAELDWLVGDWIDESDESVVATNCRWSDDGNWLLQDYVVRLAGGPEMTGTQRIGWDASRRQIRSWSFDSEGGHLEAAWSYDGSRWTAQVSGVAADGAIGSGTRMITPLGPDAYMLQSFHRILDGESLPDNEVTVVRRPPAEEAAAAERDPPIDTQEAPPAETTPREPSPSSN